MYMRFRLNSGKSVLFIGCLGPVSGYGINSDDRIVMDAVVASEVGGDISPLAALGRDDR